MSHTSPGDGIRYDYTYRPGTALGFYWQWFERPFLESVFARLAADRPRGRYLDFACGTGRILDVGADYFADSTGIDVSESMLEVARRKRPSATIVCTDVLAEPPAMEPVDVITLFRFLLRARNLRNPILHWLRGMIRDDGILIVSNHLNSLSLRALALRLTPPNYRWDIPTELVSDRDHSA